MTTQGTNNTVIITVSGGVAEAAQWPDGIEVEIIDFDNLLDDVTETGLLMPAVCRDYLRDARPDDWARIAPRLVTLEEQDKFMASLA